MHSGHVHNENCSHGHGHGQQHSQFANPFFPSSKCTRQTCARIISPIALFLILFAGYSVSIYIFDINLQSSNIPNDGIFYLVIWFLLIICFLRGSLASPGIVEKNWYHKHPDFYERVRNQFLQHQEMMKQQQAMMMRMQTHNNAANNQNPNNVDNSNNQNDTTINMESKQNDENERFLEIPEHVLRPPRSHYCHELEANILRMDHFCVWFNNAVGLHNYKYFILTLFYLFLFCISTDIVIVYRSFINPYPSMHVAIEEMTTFQQIWRIFCLVVVVLLSIIFTIFSSMHLYFHFWQLSKGLTSIEYHQWSQMRAMGYHLGVPFHNTHEFDFGHWNNCERMLGKDWYFWFIPTSPWLVEDGYKYEVNNESRQAVMEYSQKIHKKRQEIWQKQGLSTKNYHNDMNA